MANATRNKPLQSPEIGEERLKKPQLSLLHIDVQPSRLEECAIQGKKASSLQVESPPPDTVANRKDSNEAILEAKEPGNSTCPEANVPETNEFLRSAFPLDAGDVDALSSTMDSQSTPSEAAHTRMKPIKIVQSKSPELPPITPQNRLSIGVLSDLPESDPERLQQRDQVHKLTTINKEEERQEIIAQTSGSASESAAQLSTVEELSPPPNFLASDTADNLSPRLSALARSPIKDKLGVSDDIENIDPRSAEQEIKGHKTSGTFRDSASLVASESSDDESFYDELQAATVEEAKPVMVARSPINAVFNRGSPDRERAHNRSLSILSRRTDESMKSTPERMNAGIGLMTSSALPRWPPAVESAQSLLVKKANVSTGISKRIRALEIFSGRTDSGPSSPNLAAPPSPPLTTGLVIKRLSSHSPRQSQVHDKINSTPPGKQLFYPTPSPTPTPTPLSTDIQSSWLQRNGSNISVNGLRRKGDSVSVTARIVRDSAGNDSKDSRNLSNLNSMNLHRSPLVVEHEKAAPNPQRETPKGAGLNSTPVPSREAEPTTKETTKSERRRFSLSSTHSNSGQIVQSESFTKRLSMTMRHPRPDPSTIPRSASDSSSLMDEKTGKGSRKTRLMRRMSIIRSGSRRSIASALSSNSLRHEEPTSLMSRPPASIAEYSAEMTPQSSSVAEPNAHVMDIGDVNIQFPDTLLWKRRFMRIDDQGFLILTPPTMEANKRGVSRRFHLSDIKEPCLPALEREELPWSILLDFEDGSCLQCACEQICSGTGLEK